jgi:hypothetical protein
MLANQGPRCRHGSRTERHSLTVGFARVSVKFFGARAPLFGVRMEHGSRGLSTFGEGPVWLCDGNLLFTKDVYGL